MNVVCACDIINVLLWITNFTEYITVKRHHNIRSAHDTITAFIYWSCSANFMLEIVWTLCYVTDKIIHTDDQLNAKCCSIYPISIYCRIVELYKSVGATTKSKDWFRVGTSELQLGRRLVPLTGIHRCEMGLQGPTETIIQCQGVGVGTDLGIAFKAWKTNGSTFSEPLHICLTIHIYSLSS